MNNKIFATMGALAVLACALASGCVIVAGNGNSGGSGGEGVGGAVGVGGAGGAGGAGGGTAGGGGTGGAAACLTCGEFTPTLIGGITADPNDKTIAMGCTDKTDPNGVNSQALLVEFYNCACANGGACAVDCGANLCSGMDPDAACAKCNNDVAAGCGTPFGACSADAPK